MADLNESLTELLRPLVREIVRDEIKRAQVKRRYVPVKLAAEQLGITEAAARRRVLRGQLPGKKIESRVYVDMEKLDNWLEGRLR